MDDSRSHQRRDLNVPSIKLAGVLIRRKDNCRRHPQTSAYNAKEYEVLLRAWPLEPFLDHLALFSGPMIDVRDPEGTLVVQCHNWTQRIVDKLGFQNVQGLQAIGAHFIALVGGSRPTEFLPYVRHGQLGMMLCFVMPLTREGSSVVSHFPRMGRFPRFHCLHRTLVGMYTNTLKVHPLTREALSALDKWLRERHSVPNALNILFSPPAEQRLFRCVTNPMLASSAANRQQDLCCETLKALETAHEEEAVENYIRNSLFGSDLQYGDKVNTFICNENFGIGEPDYMAIGTEPPKWIAVKTPQNGGLDWVESFPMHKYACEGDVAGIRKCLALNLSSNVLDSDGWGALHYASWYGELDAVVALVEECGARTKLPNASGSTPLHMAAGNSHTRVVEYLLNQGVNTSALDNDGKSPLALCLENKADDWRNTAAMLRAAYTEQMDGQMYKRPTRQKKRVMFGSSEEVNMDEEEVNMDEENLAGIDLSIRGSLTSLALQAKGRKRSPTVKKMRINFMNGHHQLANFCKGKETLASQVLQETCHLMGIDMEYQYLFALWIVSSSLAIQLGDTDKPLKLIGKWPLLLRKFATAQSSESPSLYVRRNVFFPSLREQVVPDPVTLEYLYADAQRHVKNGTYPCSEDEAVELAAISMQLSQGDYNPAMHQPEFLKTQLQNLLPQSLIKSRKRADLEKRVCTKHHEISKQGYDVVKLYHKYLEYCRRWPYYSSTFYEGVLQYKLKKISTTSVMSPGRTGRHNTSVLLGINSLGFHLINKDSNMYAQSYTLEEMEWSLLSEKQIFLLRALDGSVELPIQSKKAPLMQSLATRMKEELDKLRERRVNEEPFNDEID